MQAKRGILAVLLAWAFLTASGGCTLEKAARDGAYDGISSSLATAIQAPVDYFLDIIFAAPE